ncbi:MAG: ATP-dependent DNA helicase PcrA [Parcubacteria group bacterium]|nr:ATP-dependent DNA helicase PcrA [Parcubacteria group bacterium]|tara:strand:- start:8962 stop:10908 length:1947 start_codon:yes stop_codon:yes gene_type:complete
MTHFELNPQQKEAVAHDSGPLMILAGAGAGKTRVITQRILELIKKGTPPEKILAVTFTNKAAKEMRERVLAMIDADVEINRPVSARATGLASPYVSTFHSLGVSILRENAKELGLKRHFTIFDRADSVRAIKNALKHLGLDPKQFEPRAMLSVISRHKSDGLSADTYQPDIGDIKRHTLGRIWKEYEARLKKEGALDFDDLLLRTYIVLRDNAAVREHYQKRWSHVHVDEYQDTNRVQFALTQLLVDEKANICVVGDIDQNIYSWRGANLANLLTFEEEFPGTKLVLLEENYRSTQNILAAANIIIEKNVKRKDKTLYTKNEAGELLGLYSAYSEDDEARFIVQTSQERIDAGVPPREIAVLYRANFQSRALEQAFMFRGIPYQVLGTRFFDRKEVKDVLSYIRAALNPDSQGDIARIVSTPPRGIGKMTLSKMFGGTEHELSPTLQKKVGAFKAILKAIRDKALSEKPSETIRFTVQASGLEMKLRGGTEEDRERLENIKELATLASKYDELPPEEGIEKLLEDAALATDQDSLVKNHNAVKLMTVHASKGLEFDYVFVAGLEEGLFPHEKLDQNTDEEEERRLFYVALTRARKKVFLTHAIIRSIFGSQSMQTASQFIDDISEEYIENSDEDRTPPHERKMDLIDF